MTLEIFIPCYYGSVVIHKSEQLTTKIFNSSWINRSKKYRSSIRIMLQRSLKPIIPLAGGMFVIALPTFVTVNICFHFYVLFFYDFFFYNFRSYELLIHYLHS